LRGDQLSVYELGSLAQVIGKEVPGRGVRLPEWGSEIPLPGVRDAVVTEEAGTVAGGRGTEAVMGGVVVEKVREKKVWKDLERFYASESEEDDGEEEDEDEDEDGDEEEENGGDEEEEENDSEEETDEDEGQPLSQQWK
jgi:cobalamin biosynthesis protein CobT